MMRLTLMLSRAGQGILSFDEQLANRRGKDGLKWPVLAARHRSLRQFHQASLLQEIFHLLPAQEPPQHGISPAQFVQTHHLQHLPARVQQELHGGLLQGFVEITNLLIALGGLPRIELLITQRQRQVCLHLHAGKGEQQIAAGLFPFARLQLHIKIRVRRSLAMPRYADDLLQLDPLLVGFPRLPVQTHVHLFLGGEEGQSAPERE